MSITYESGFVSSWGTAETTVDVTHAVSTCNAGASSSIATTVTMSSGGTIGLLSADNGRINIGTGPGTFHFDFYNTGANEVSVNVDDVVQSTSGIYTDSWSWIGSSTVCTVAVPIV